MQKILFSLFLAFLATIIAGCQANVYRMKETSFLPPVTDPKYETMVYVYREDVDSFSSLLVDVGSGTIKGSLKPGSFCVFPVNTSESHLVTISSSKILYNAMFIHPTDGEPIYLFFTFRDKKAHFTKIPQEHAQRLQAQYVFTVIEKKYELNPVYEQWYNIILFNPESSADLSIMRPTDRRLTPDSDHAVITFLRASRVFHNLKAGIWSEDNFLGNLGGGHALQIKVPPGKHLYVGKMEHWSLLDTELAPNKEYFVKVTVTMGWKAPHVRLIPIGSEMSEEERNELIVAANSYFEINPEIMNEKMRDHFKEAVPKIRGAITQMNSGKLEKRVLKITDGR